MGGRGREKKKGKGKGEEELSVSWSSRGEGRYGRSAIVREVAKQRQKEMTEEDVERETIE